MGWSICWRGCAGASEPPVCPGHTGPVSRARVVSYQLAFLAAHDADPFNRWEAAQRLATRAILALNDGADPPTPLSRTFEATEDRLTGPNTTRLADDTGGLAIGGTNDLGEGLSVVAEELGQLRRAELAQYGKCMFAHA